MSMRSNQNTQLQSRGVVLYWISITAFGLRVVREKTVGSYAVYVPLTLLSLEILLVVIELYTECYGMIFFFLSNNTNSILGERFTVIFESLCADSI